MTNRHWRELLEIAGVASIVAALLLLAVQVRHSNRIAAAQTALQLASAYDTLHLERAGNPDFAKLFPKLEAPDAHLTTATEASQIRGMAQHYFGILGAVQSAFDSGLIDTATRDSYVAAFALSIEKWPGIRPHYVVLYERLGMNQDAAVYTPIAAYIESQRAPAASTEN